ncbi:MAG: CNNM domain-containing protein [Campylobacterota bacterium]|nr:CNNM domain-containing protein [Campylobacterota bacterium]
MDLLILYFLAAVVISFICSVLESVLLSVNMPYISVLEKERPKVGALLKSHKTNINKSIASILILNTIANTLGAAAVGAQAESLYGAGAVFYVSIILTFAILFFSEIIPKTMGAVYWKTLAPTAAYIIQIFIWMTYPIILLTLFVTNRINKEDEGTSLSREELIESTLMSEDEGVLDEKESDVIENILLLDKIKIEEILTPRTVVFALDGNRSIKDIVDNEPAIFKFSRVPVFDGNMENIIGMVMTKKIFKQALKDDTVKLQTIKKDMYKINENIPVSMALDLFIKKKEHMFLVQDSYDQTEGIVTLEDCVETILGVEIVDESDSDADMREVAKRKMRLKRRLENTELTLD